MEVMLWTMIGYDLSSSWVKLLPIIEFAINTNKSDSSRQTPFDLLYGFTPKDLSNVWQPTTLPQVDDVLESRESIWKDAWEALAYARATMARVYDISHHTSNISLGDEVYIENRTGYRIPGLTSTKLAPKRFGPFRVIKAIGKHAYRLQLPPSYKIHDVFSQRHLHKVNTDEFHRLPIPPPPIMEDDDGMGEFEVECVLDHRTTRRGDVSYLVKWTGYPVHESTWISEKESDSFSHAVQDYLTKQKIVLPIKQMPQPSRKSSRKSVRFG